MIINYYLCIFNNLHLAVIVVGRALLSQPGINTYGMGWKNVPRHARVLFANFKTASKSPVFANVAIPRLSTAALGAAGGIIRLRRLFFRV